VVGGPSPEGDWTERLKVQVADLGLQERVRFFGAIPPDEATRPHAAADVFVLATRNEGWANVFLEAMACQLPIVTTDVGGNAEVVSDTSLGTLVPFGDQEALTLALRNSLLKAWNREAILAHARRNSWTDRAVVLVDEFVGIWRNHDSAPAIAGHEA